MTNIKTLLKYIIYISIFTLFISLHYIKKENSYYKFNSLDYLKINIAIKKADKKTIAYHAKQVIKRNNNNIYYIASCDLLKKISKKKYICKKQFILHKKNKINISNK